MQTVSVILPTISWMHFKSNCMHSIIINVNICVCLCSQFSHAVNVGNNDTTLKFALTTIEHRICNSTTGNNKSTFESTMRDWKCIISVDFSHFLSNALEFFQFFFISSKFFKNLSNSSKKFKNLQNSSRKFKNLQNSSKIFTILQVSPNFSKISSFFSIPCVISHSNK